MIFSHFNDLSLVVSPILPSLEIVKLEGKSPKVLSGYFCGLKALLVIFVSVDRSRAMTVQVVRRARDRSNGAKSSQKGKKSRLRNLSYSLLLCVLCDLCGQKNKIYHRDRRAHRENIK